MKSFHLACLLLFSAVSVAPALAQQPRTHQRSGKSTYQMLEFKFTTGDDDLRRDSSVVAHLTFPDGSTQDCPLHNARAAGNDASSTWDNHSTRIGAPCHLDKPRPPADLKRAVISLKMESREAIDIGVTVDNWDINRAIVTAYNSGSPGRICVFDGSGNPLARMTFTEPTLTLTDLRSHCR